MKYTCKQCCVILKQRTACPICKKEDQIIPIEINVQRNNTKA